MTILITIGIIFSLVLGFGLSRVLVYAKLKNKNKVIKNTAFILFGNAFSIMAMAITIFTLWPTHM